MSFKLSTIYELPTSARISDSNGRVGAESAVFDGIEMDSQQQQEKVLHFAYISEDDFLLVIMLTTRENLIVYYNTGNSSRCEIVKISRLFPNQQFPCSPALIALTEDASVVVILLTDSDSILLIPFPALMDVTWGRRSTPLVTKPMYFSISAGNEEGTQQMRVTITGLDWKPNAAVCFHSRLAERTYLLFGNKAGALFLVDLHLKRVSIRIDLRAGIQSMHIHLDEQEEQKQLLITQNDLTQIILPLEYKDMAIRETLARTIPADISHLDKHFNYFPQPNGDGNALCSLNKRARSLKYFTSLDNLKSKCEGQGKHSVELHHFPTVDGIQNLLFSFWMVIASTTKSQLFVHLRFLQSNYEHAEFSPIKVDTNATQVILGLIPSNGFPHFSRPPTKADLQMETCSIVTESGLYWLRPEKSLHGFLLDHLSIQLFSTDSLSSLAQCLLISADSLCLSLLRTLLKHTSPVVDEKTSAQIDGLLSLAFVYNVDPNLLLNLLQKYGQSDLLLPFLRLKCERNPSDSSLQQLLLAVMLAKIARISGEDQQQNGINAEMNQKRVVERDAAEYELRHFLVQFDVSEQEVLPLLLRHSLWSCVCLLLARNPHEHSLMVARFLLELPAWKNDPRVGGLLRCLSFLYWSSLDSYTPTLAVRLYNLVPSLDIAQLKTVRRIADSLLERSVESALSLKLLASMRLLGLMIGNQPTTVQPIHQAIQHNRSLACGSNCTLLLAEDEIGGGRGGAGQSNEVTSEQNPVRENGCQPMFWGEFVAGTVRLIREEQTGKHLPQPTSSRTSESPFKRRKEEPVEEEKKEENRGRKSSRKQQLQLRETLLKQRQNQFPLVAMPRVVQVSAQTEICSVASGTEHELLLAADGRLFSWGRNRFGQCGVGHKLAVPVPIEIHGPWERAIGIYAGHYHSCLLTASNEVWLWGWAMYGQLGNGQIEDKLVPERSVSISSLGAIKTLCLGYAHSLVLLADGRVFGCGAMAHGQLGVDPADMGGRQKMLLPIEMPFPTPIGLLACSYFHGVALSMDGQQLFEWSESPQNLKMRMFLQKRLRAKQQQTTKDGRQKQNEKVPNEVGKSEKEGEELMAVEPDNAENSGKSATTVPTSTAAIEMPRGHFHIRRLCQWEGAPVTTLSAGFNHSALLTADGELFTWGKALEMQLGHGTRKERATPARVEEPKDIKWADVVCSRNFTVAISTEGLVFVWGRNDRNQLGIGTREKKQPPIRRILLKSEKGKPQRAVELPADNCVEKPTVVAALKVATSEQVDAPTTENQLTSLLASADQQTISSLSRSLVRHPVPAFVAVQTHLMAGDLLPAIRLLIEISRREHLLDESKANSTGIDRVEAEREVSVIAKVGKSQSPSGNVPSGARMGTLKVSPASKDNPVSISNASPAERIQPRTTPRTVSVQLRRSGAKQLSQQDISSPFLPSIADSNESQNMRLEQFHTLIDRLWTLLRVHPIREVQTAALVELLHARFPIYNRLVADQRLCRLIEPFLTLAAAPKKFLELTVRERQSALRVAPPPDIGNRRFHSLKVRCEQLLAHDRLRYFADCGHFEKCVVESGPVRSELATQRNRMRRCTRCVNSRRSSGRAAESMT